MIPRILLMAVMATCLSSCGTATHLLGQASGLLGTVTAPITGILHLSDSPVNADENQPKQKKTVTRANQHDRQRTEAQCHD